jgi:hypothetical protein
MVIDNLRKNSNLNIDFDYFAKSVKDQSKDIFKPLIEYLNDVSERFNVPEIFTTNDNWYEEKNKITRILLQTYGTEIFRDMIDSDHWAKILRNRTMERDEDILFITDVRFKSEMNLICDKSSYIFNYRTINPSYNILKLRIERDTYERKDESIFTHPSEIDLDDYKHWDEVVYNNGTKEDLEQKALEMSKTIMEKFYGKI